MAWLLPSKSTQCLQTLNTRWASQGKPQRTPTLKQGTSQLHAGAQLSAPTCAREGRKHQHTVSSLAHLQHEMVARDGQCLVFALWLAAGPHTRAAHISPARSRGAFLQPHTLPPSKGTINCQSRNKTTGGGRSIWAFKGSLIKGLTGSLPPCILPCMWERTALVRVQGNTRRAHARAGNSLPGTYGHGRAQTYPRAVFRETGLQGPQYLGPTATIRLRDFAESDRTSRWLRAHAGKKGYELHHSFTGVWEPLRPQHNSNMHQAERI